MNSDCDWKGALYIDSLLPRTERIRLKWDMRAEKASDFTMPHSIQPLLTSPLDVLVDAVFAREKCDTDLQMVN